MAIKLIETEKEYQEALYRVDALMDAKPDSTEEKELELLAVLVEKYEDEHYPIKLPDPIEAIKFRMEQEGLTQKDLVPYIGSQSKVSEVLNKRRPLSLNMIRSLHEGLGIPTEVLIQKPVGIIPEKHSEHDDLPFNEVLNQEGLYERRTRTTALGVREGKRRPGG
jgi:HTH-type transcriptional regulator / antitoxin HigA